MRNTHSNRCKYVAAALLGVAAGGLALALTTRALPKVMSGMKARMMQECERMMAGSEGASQHAGCGSSEELGESAASSADEHSCHLKEA